MARFSRYAGLHEATREYIEKALEEGDGSISAVEELAIARLAANDTVKLWSAAIESDQTTPQTRQMANSLVMDTVERVSDIALRAARTKAAMTPATVIQVIVPMIQRVVAIIYAEMSALPQQAERIHRRISDELHLEIATPSVATVSRTVDQIDQTVPKVY